MAERVGEIRSRARRIAFTFYESMFSALLFAWLQGTDFYKELHHYAVARIPAGAEGTWIEVGCGPGLMSRLAAKKGYRVTGIDLNRPSIWLARLFGTIRRSSAQFEVGTHDVLKNRTASVVAASSLLAVLSHKKEGLDTLWSGVASKGYLLIIEPTHKLSGANVAGHISRSTGSSNRMRGLRMWARAREGRTVAANIFDGLKNYLEDYSETLEGMVGVWVFRKP